MAWPIDPSLRTPANAVVLAFLEREAPSAHDDVASALIASARGIGAVSWHCPDPSAYAWMALRTEDHTIVGLAWGMDALAFRLPADALPDALAAGATPCPQIGDGWVRFAPWGDLSRWCRLAARGGIGRDAA